MTRKFKAAAFGIWLAISGLADASTGILAHDAYISTINANTKFGGQGVLRVKGAENTTYITFSPSTGLAAGMLPSQVTKVSLRLFVNTVTVPGQFDVYQLDSPWNETTVTGNAAPVLGAKILANVNVPRTSRNKWLNLNLTNLTKNWLTGAAANNGIALVGVGTTDISFDSKESGTTSHEPSLEFVLTGPQGIQGVQGLPGQQSIASVSNFSGFIASNMVFPTINYVFAGPTATVTTTAGQRLVGVAEAPLRVSTGIASFLYGLCYGSVTGGALTNFMGGNYSLGELSATLIPWTASASVVPGAGTWNVGFCAQGNGGDVVTGANDFVNGWVMVVNP